jgi:hypothetical protein
MRINHLHVSNFKGFEDKTFDFPRSIDAPENGNGSFHVIIGQNAMGKTSVLDALAVAVGSWFLGVRGEDSRHIQPGDVRILVQSFGDRYETNPNHELFETIIEWALSEGFYSVWMTVFDDVPAIRARLISDFPGTATDCFDANTANITPRPNNGLTGGGKI